MVDEEGQGRRGDAAAGRGRGRGRRAGPVRGRAARRRARCHPRLLGEQRCTATRSSRSSSRAAMVHRRRAGSSTRRPPARRRTRGSVSALRDRRQASVFDPLSAARPANGWPRLGLLRAALPGRRRRDARGLRTPREGVRAPTHATHQVAHAARRASPRGALEVLDEARRKIDAILAEDGSRRRRRRPRGCEGRRPGCGARTRPRG